MTQINTMEQLSGLDAGSTINVDGRAWVKAEGGWTNASFTLTDEAFLDAVENDRVRVVAGGTPAVGARPDWMVVGHTLATREEIDALPVGTVIRGGTDDYVKVGEGGYSGRLHTGWGRPDGSDYDGYFALGYNRIISLPEVAEGRPDWMVEGHRLTTHEQFEALPVGTEVRAGTSRYRRMAPGGFILASGTSASHQGWETYNGSRFVANTGGRTFTLTTNNRIHSLPEDSVAEVPPVGVGFIVRERSDFDRLPIGAVMRPTLEHRVGGAGEWQFRVRENGLVGIVGDTRDVDFDGWNARGYFEVMSLPESAPQWVVGQRIERNEQFTQLPPNVLIVECNSQPFDPANASNRPIRRYDPTRVRGEMREVDINGVEQRGGHLSVSNFMSGQNHYVIAVLPTSEFTVGQVVNQEMLSRLPMGTVVRNNASDSRHTRLENGRWQCSSGDNTCTDDSVWRYFQTGLRIEHLPEVTAAPAPPSDPTQAALAEYLAGQSDPRAAELMRVLGLAAPTETVFVSVNVVGQYSMNVTPHLEGRIGGGVTVTNGVIFAGWTRLLRLRQSVQRGRCNHGEISRDAVRSALREAGVTVEAIDGTWSFTVRNCDNCDHPF